MFKNVFLLSISSSLFSTVFSYVYMNIYFHKIVDFSESFGITAVFINNLIAFMIGFFVFLGIKKLIKKESISEFTFNLLVTMITFMSIFHVLQMTDPEFKNEEAGVMIDYYKCYLMPLLFFPALSWFVLKPIFIKNNYFKIL